MLSAMTHTVWIPRGVKGTAATIQWMGRLAIQGAHDPDLAYLARRQVSNLQGHDHRAEADRLFRWVKRDVRYTWDPRGLEWVQTPRMTLLTLGTGDCFPAGTLLAVKGRDWLTPIIDVSVGDEVWDGQAYTRVTQVWDRGLRETWALTLSTDAEIRLSPDHKLWPADATDPDDRVLLRDIAPGFRFPRASQWPVSNLDESDLDDLTFIRRHHKPVIEAIRKDNLALPCVDIAVESRRIWLDHDIVVSNCDDASSALAALWLTVGLPARFITYAADKSRPEEWSHVAAQVQVGGRWFTGDATQPESYFGWDPQPPLAWASRTWEIGA